MEYFDLKVASTSEVITSVSGDSLVIQDVLSEKVYSGSPLISSVVSTSLGSKITDAYVNANG